MDEQHFVIMNNIDLSRKFSRIVDTILDSRSFYKIYCYPDKVFLLKISQPLVPGRNLPVRPKSAMTRNKRNQNQIKSRPKVSFTESSSKFREIKLITSL